MQGRVGVKFTIFLESGFIDKSCRIRSVHSVESNLHSANKPELGFQVSGDFKLKGVGTKNIQVETKEIGIEWN